MSGEPSRPTVAVLGAGTMGPALAAVFALRKHRVSLIDVDTSALEDARQRAEAVAAAWQGSEAALVVRSRLETTSDLESGIAGADLVIEAVTEDLATKQHLFARLDALASEDTILCSNTSALPIAEVTARVQGSERVLGTHWFNPPHLVPAVEVIRGPDTSDATVARVMTLLRQLGKEPVEVTDTPGFLANRLQMALAKEAILCLQEGVATAADIDRLFANSIGFRLAAAGPLAIADFAGLDVYQHVFETLASGVAERFSSPRLLGELVEQGHLGVKAASGFLDYGDHADDLVALRDRRLLALSRLRSMPEWLSLDGQAPTSGLRSLLLSENDSVVVVLQDVGAGERVDVPDQDPVVAAADIPAGHKLAIRAVGEGEIVVKYGEPIGIASRPIEPGDHVHLHNLASARAGGSAAG